MATDVSKLQEKFANLPAEDLDTTGPDVFETADVPGALNTEVRCHLLQRSTGLMFANPRQQMTTMTILDCTEQSHTSRRTEKTSLQNPWILPMRESVSRDTTCKAGVRTTSKCVLGLLTKLYEQTSLAK